MSEHSSQSSEHAPIGPLTEWPSIQTHRLKHEIGEHVFILLECDDGPPVSLDIANWHGRRGLSVRVDGMGMFSALLDVQEMDPESGPRMQRFCPYCGEKLNLISSKAHSCAEGDPR